MYFPSATGTAVTRLVHVKFLPGRLPPSPVHSQHSSQVLQNLQHQLGLIAVGEAGKQAATAVGLRCSADTLLRRVINTPETKQSGAPHVGIDEWAWHRGHHYGTLIVNLDTHRPLVLLPGCDQSTLATWFRKYPEIQGVSRDRGGVYATAAREGAPQARQIADRWHLLKNTGDAPERMMYRQMPLIRLVASGLSPKKSPKPVLSVPVASLRRPERLKQQTRQKRHQRWTEVMALHNKGCGFRGNIPYYRLITCDSQSLGVFRNIP